MCAVSVMFYITRSEYFGVGSALSLCVGLPCVFEDKGQPKFPLNSLAIP